MRSLTKRETFPVRVKKNHQVRLSRTEEISFRGGVADVIIFPSVFAALAAKTLFQRIVSILIKILDYAFPLLMQLVRLPLFAARIFGDGAALTLKGVLSCLPITEAKRQRWNESIRQYWSWLRQKISYRTFEEAVHRAFELGMAWVFRKCRHLTPGSALLVITGAVLWLPISLGAATAMHALLFAKVASWPAWMQLLHPLATILAKSKLLVLPVYPAAWPQAKKHPFIQIILESYQAFKSLHLVEKTRFRYRQTERVTMAAIDKLLGVAGFIGLTRAVMWFRNKFRDEENRNVTKPSQKLRSLFARWSIKFTAKYYEDKERDNRHQGRHDP